MVHWLENEVDRWYIWFWDEVAIRFQAPPMYIEIESAKMANSRFESMNEEEFAHLLDDKNSKNTKKIDRDKSIAFWNVSSRERNLKSYNNRGIGDGFAKILLLL